MSGDRPRWRGAPDEPGAERRARWRRWFSRQAKRQLVLLWLLPKGISGRFFKGGT